MTLHNLPPLARAAASLWAKSPRKNADGSPGALVPVLNHLLDVAACAAEILALEPERTRRAMAADLGLSEAQGLPWVLLLVAAHDLGKASPAFQVLWEEGRLRVDAALACPPPHEDPSPHGLVTQVTLPPLLVGGLGWSPALARGVADAVGCHHGFRASHEQLRLASAQLGDGHWGKVRAKLLELCAQALGADPQLTPPVAELSPAGFMRLAGLTSFADWLGSSFAAPEQTEYRAHHDPAGYYAGAREKARQTLQDMHWPAFAPLRGALPTIAEVFGYLSEPAPFRPRPLQQGLARELASVSRPTLCVVEAPMGEGKTEAALYAYLQLQAALHHRGLYVALPTQATGNAMYTRLAEFLERQGRQRPPSLQLAHGGTLLSRPFQERLERTRAAHLAPAPNREEDAAQAVRAEAWFGQRKRALLDEYGVGTVDQALLGVLGVSHQFVRLWGLGNRVVVLDEVHAYDTYTSELIAALVGWLRALDSSVVLMSATLPQRSREQLLAAWGADSVDDGAVGYPRLTVAEVGEQVRTVSIPAGESSRPEQSIAVQPLGSAAAEVAARAAELVADGGNVAVIVNTVKRAQEVQRLVVEQLRARRLVAQTCTDLPPRAEREWPRVGVLLYHARYPAEERLLREERVLRYLGKKGERPERFVLIATQVAEQSLDFDADVMISDLAPADLLLQRAGRLHRHAHNAGRRGGHEQAALHVAGLDGWPREAAQAESWDRVYHPALLYRSWAALRELRDRGGGLTLPGDLDPLVQRVYAETFHSPLLSGEQAAELLQAEGNLEGERAKLGGLGGSAHIGHPAEFWGKMIRSVRGKDDHDATDDDEFLGTRLGEQGLRIVPVFRDHDGAWSVCPLPERLQSGKSERIVPCFATLPQTDNERALRIYRRSLNVADHQVRRHAHERWGQQREPLGSAQKRQGWAAHPLLRDAVPVCFEGGRAVITERLTLLLHPELGLVYERPSRS